MIDALVPGWTGRPVTINPTPAQRRTRIIARMETLRNARVKCRDRELAQEYEQERVALQAELAKLTE